MINLNNDEWHYDEQNAKVVIKPWGREVWINFRKMEKVKNRITNNDRVTGQGQKSNH